jgi:hypothetical protein
MHFISSQHEIMEGTEQKTLDPPGSSAPERRQAGLGCQPRPGGVKAGAHALTRHGHGRGAPTMQPAHGAASQRPTGGDAAVARTGRV